MRFSNVLLASAAFGFSAPAVSAASALDVSGLPPHFARYLLTHPDAGARFAALRAGRAEEASGPPAIMSGLIPTAKVDVLKAPAAPAVTIKYSAPGILSQVFFEFSNAAGQYYGINYELNSPVARGGTITFQDPYNSFGLYSMPGTWTLVEADLIDNEGSGTYYSQGELTALFPRLTFALTNPGAPDGTPPSFSTGTILTPAVHLRSKHPYFAAELETSDNSSGVEGVYVLVTDPDNTQHEAYAILPMAVRSGRQTVYFQFSPNVSYAVGTWTITAIELFDVAGNSMTDTSAADIKAAFGTTTFSVIK